MALFSFGNVNRRWITLVASWIQTLLPVWMWMITFWGQPPNYHRPAFYYHPWLWGIIVVDIDIDIDTDIDTYIYILFIYLFIYLNLLHIVDLSPFFQANFPQVCSVFRKISWFPTLPRNLPWRLRRAVKPGRPSGDDFSPGWHGQSQF